MKELRLYCVFCVKNLMNAALKGKSLKLLGEEWNLNQGSKGNSNI